MTTIRCYFCGEFFDKREKECPECGTPQRDVNTHLVAGRWSGNLNAHAEHAVKYT